MAGLEAGLRCSAEQTVSDGKGARYRGSLPPGLGRVRPQHKGIPAMELPSPGWCPGRQPPSPAPTLRHGRKGDFQRPLPAAPESTPLANGLTLAVVGMPSPLGFCSSFLATVAFSSSDLSGSPLSWKTKQSQSGGPAPPWKRTSTFWGPLSLRAPSPTPPRARGGGLSVGAGAAQAEHVLPPR